MRYGTLLLFVVGPLLFSCGRQEKRASEALQAARDMVNVNKGDAIEMLEAILINYPDTNAANETREQLPLLVFKNTLESIGRDMEGFSIDGYTGQQIFKQEHITSLVRIIEDFPEHKTAEGISSVIMYIKMLNVVAPYMWKFKVKMEAINAYIELTISKPGSYEEELRWRAEAVETTIREMGEGINEFLVPAFHEIAKALRSISPDNYLRDKFTEIAEHLDDISIHAKELSQGMSKVADWYKDNGYDCMIAANDFSEGNIVSNWLKKRKNSKCAKQVKKIESELEPIVKRMEAPQKEVEKILQEAKKQSEEYWVSIAELDPFQALSKGINATQ